MVQRLLLTIHTQQTYCFGNCSCLHHHVHCKPGRFGLLGRTSCCDQTRLWTICITDHSLPTYITPYSSVKVNGLFGETCHLHLQCRWISQVRNQATRCYILEDRNHHTDVCENLNPTTFIAYVRFLYLPSECTFWFVVWYHDQLGKILNAFCWSACEAKRSEILPIHSKESFEASIGILLHD
jgi:hypothetical protein